MTVTRPILRWHGGKWLLGPWVLEHLPPHRVYVEPFGGAASVLLRKARSYAEVYNDLDEDVVTLFRVLRDEQSSAELIRLLEVTPFARAEFEAAWAEVNDPVETARRLIIRSFMGFGSHAHSDKRNGHKKKGFRSSSNRSGTTPAHDWMNYPTCLPAVIERLRGVIVERRPAVQVMATHDGPDTLHFVDPPYLPETRGRGNKYDAKHQYRHELSVADHAELLKFLRDRQGMVVLCGYPSDMYDDALVDWKRVERPALADGARPRTEVMWLNPRCADLLARHAPQLSLLDGTS